MLAKTDNWMQSVARLNLILLQDVFACWLLPFGVTCYAILKQWRSLKLLYKPPFFLTVVDFQCCWKTWLLKHWHSRNLDLKKCTAATWRTEQAKWHFSHVCAALAVQSYKPWKLFYLSIGHVFEKFGALDTSNNLNMCLERCSRLPAAALHHALTMTFVHVDFSYQNLGFSRI